MLLKLKQVMTVVYMDGFCMKLQCTQHLYSIFDNVHINVHEVLRTRQFSI